MSQPRPGSARYERSFSGLVAAMVVLVVVVLVFVGYRAVFRAELEVDPAAVDYRDAAQAVAAAGQPVVVPTSLPEGWVATSAEVERGEPAIWRLGVLTGDERFVGLRQGAVDAEELLETTYPDEEAVAADAVQVPDAAVATTWEAWRVGEDLAWAAEVGSTTVLVHGSAPAEDLAAFVEALEELPAGQPGT